MPDVSDIPGWLTQPEADELTRLAAGRSCLELGSYCGRSSVAIAAAARSLHCIDPFDGRATPDRRDTLGEFLAAVTRHGVGDRVTYADTTVTEWTSVPGRGGHWYDFIFVDADHTVTSILADFEAIHDRCNPAGVVAVHDYGNPEYPGVAVACDAIFHRPPDRLVDSLAVYLLDGPLPGRTLYVTTTVSRPDNLATLRAAVDALRAQLPGWCVRWLVFLDRAIDYAFPVDGAHFTARQSPGGRWGMCGRNDALDVIREGWVYHLDDDNDVHPDFAHALQMAAAAHPAAMGYVWEQVFPDGSPRLAADPAATVNNVDTAQFMFRRSAIGSHRFKVDAYEADGLFFEAVTASSPVVAVPGRVYYNKLRG